MPFAMYRARVATLASVTGGRFAPPSLSGGQSGNTFQPCDMCQKPCRGKRCFKCSEAAGDKRPERAEPGET